MNHFCSILKNHIAQSIELSFSHLVVHLTEPPTKRVKIMCSHSHSFPRPTPLQPRGVRNLPVRSARPYRAHVSDTNNASDIEQPGEVERNKMRPSGGTGPIAIFPDLAVYAGGPHGRPFCAAGTGRHRGAPSIRIIEGCNKTCGDLFQKYGAPAPLKVHIVRGSL